MKVKYQYYEPNQGLEELQAEIYSKVSGHPVPSERIKARYKDQKKDPKTTLYALTEDGDPLAYVQATNSTSHVGRTHISYPWALPACTLKVQEKIFDKVLTYLLHQKKILEITAPLVMSVKNFEERREFFKKKGFSEKERMYYYTYDYNIKEVINWELNDDIKFLTCRTAELKDIEKLTEFCLVDPNWQFLTREVALDFFKNRVFPNSNVTMVLDENQLVSVGAIIRVQPGDPILSVTEELVYLSFSATRPGYQNAWKRLLIELAKECLTLGWDNLPLRVEFRFLTSSTAAINLASLRPELEDVEIIYAYQIKT